MHLMKNQGTGTAHLALHKTTYESIQNPSQISAQGFERSLVEFCVKVFSLSKDNIVAVLPSVCVCACETLPKQYHLIF